MIKNPPDELMDNRCDPDTRAVLEDWERSRYGSSDVARRWRALSFIADADAVGDAAAAAAAGWTEGFATHANMVHPRCNAETALPDPDGPVAGCCCKAPNWCPRHKDAEPAAKPRRKARRSTRR